MFETERPTVLRAEALKKSYGAVDVLHGVELEMKEGEFLVLVGPSGCGKSTLLNCIAGLEEISSGRLFIDGADVTSIPPKDRDIAMVFQSYALYPTMTVAENIGFGMRIRKVPKDQMHARVRQVAELLQIETLLDRKPSQLSGGQRQRVAMGRALVRDPKLFLFDEPLSNLDAKLRVEMRAEIKRLHKTTGTSIVYVTHDQIEAMTLASRIVILKDGHIQQIGTPDEIYDSPENTFVADFMGSPPMNIFPATVASSGLDIGGNRIQHAEWTLKQLPERVLFGIRPEHIMVTGEDADVMAVPLMIENTGAESYVTFDLAGQTVTARVPGRMNEATRTPIGVRFDRSTACFFDPDTGRRLVSV